MTERIKVLTEVWQKWCELDKMEFDRWLHNAMNNVPEKQMHKEDWNPGLIGGKSVRNLDEALAHSEKTINEAL